LPDILAHFPVSLATFLPYDDCFTAFRAHRFRPDSGRLWETFYQEVAGMVFSRRILGAAAAIIVFALIFPYPFLGSTLSASNSNSRERMSKVENDLVAIEPPENTCEQGICVDLYPKDGKIEGKHVSLLNPAGVNTRGQVVGLCVLDDPKHNYPFVREPDGNIWIFKTPSESGEGEFTDISDSGDAVGFYEKDSSHAQIGFLMNSRRQYVMDIQYPANQCPKDTPYLHTQPNGINDAGEIIGNYRCTQNPNDAAEAIFTGSGFYRDSEGNYYRVEYENAKRTVAGKITNAGVIIGYYVINEDTWVPFAAMKEDVIKPIVP
jgi:hypothetical protein